MTGICIHAFFFVVEYNGWFDRCVTFVCLAGYVHGKHPPYHPPHAPTLSLAGCQPPLVRCAHSIGTGIYVCVCVHVHVHVHVLLLCLCACMEFLAFVAFCTTQLINTGQWRLGMPVFARDHVMAAGTQHTTLAVTHHSTHTHTHTHTHTQTHTTTTTTTTAHTPPPFLWPPMRAATRWTGGRSSSLCGLWYVRSSHGSTTLCFSTRVVGHRTAAPPCFIAHRPWVIAW